MDEIEHMSLGGLEAELADIHRDEFTGTEKDLENWPVVVETLDGTRYSAFATLDIDHETIVIKADQEI